MVSNQVALKATEAAYAVGTRTIVDVLNAQTAVLQAERDYRVARYNYIVESLQLKKSTGTLNPNDIVQVNAWLQNVIPSKK